MAVRKLYNSGEARHRTSRCWRDTLGTRKSWIDFALKFWRLTHWAKRIGDIPPFKQMAGLVASDNNLSSSFIPVDEEIEIPPGVVAPRIIIEDYIRKASHRVIVHECVCRVGEGCSRYPRDLGCLLLGEASRNVDPGVGRPATVEEAIRHVDRALAAGLLPMLGHMRIDQAVFGLRDFNRFLTMCFCCECCCVLRSGMRRLVNVYPDSLVRLEGLRVEVTGDCVGCGECVPACPIENVRLSGGVAVIGDMCIGCGNCARACSRGSIRISIDPGSRMDEDVRRRIEGGVDIG